MVLLGRPMLCPKSTYGFVRSSYALS